MQDPRLLAVPVTLSHYSYMNLRVERLRQVLVNDSTRSYSVQMGVSLRPESVTSDTNVILSVLEAGLGNSFRTDVDES